MIKDISNNHINSILEYCMEHGETEVCTRFNINIETLHRYQRERHWRDTQNPKVLLLDIETCPIQGRFWDTGKQYVTSQQIIKDWFIFGYSAKWLFAEEIMSDFVTPAEAIARDDKRIMTSAYKLLNQCDIVIGHNIKRFDIPKLKTRFFMHGFKPPMPFQTVDTCQIVQKEFAFSSNKLTFLSKLMFNKEKLKTDYELWLMCEKGDKDSLLYMEEYCKNDTTLLENVYLEIRPWCSNHPHLPLIMNSIEPSCPICGGYTFTEEEGYYYTPQNKYEAMRCKSCGSVSHKRKSQVTGKQRKVLLVPNAR